MRLLSDHPGRLRAPAVRRRAPQAGSERHLRPIISRSKEEGIFSAGALSENARVAGPHASLESVPPPRGTANRSTPAMRQRNGSIDTCDEAARRADRRLRCGASSRSTPAMRRRELAPPLDARTRRSYTVRVGRAGHGVPQRAWRRHRADEEDQRHLAHPLDISHPHPARRICARPASAQHATATPSGAACKSAPSERMRRAARLR